MARLGYTVAGASSSTVQLQNWENNQERALWLHLSSSVWSVFVSYERTLQREHRQMDKQVLIWFQCNIYINLLTKTMQIFEAGVNNTSWTHFYSDSKSCFLNDGCDWRIFDKWFGRGRVLVSSNWPTTFPDTASVPGGHRKSQPGKVKTDFYTNSYMN